MLRTPFASERIQRVDPRTGIKVIQLTAYPLPSAHFLYDYPCVTPDNSRIVLFCQRSMARDAPWDIFRVDADGLNLYQLSERGEKMEQGGYYGRPSARMTRDGRKLYVLWGVDLCTVDVETGSTETLLALGSVCRGATFTHGLHVSCDEKRAFAVCNVGGELAVVRVDLESGKASCVPLDGYLTACDPTAPRLVVSKGTVRWGTATRADGSRVVTNEGDLRALWVVDEDGRDVEMLCPEVFAHRTLLGKHLKVQGCGLPPNRCIWLGEGGKDPVKLAQGPYFWHSGASWDGAWIVADTNWPDMGLHLVHVATGRCAPLCRAGASQDHYEFGHPHPTLSQDGSVCVFRSDRTGTPQIYAAHIPGEYRERVAAGDLSGASKWME
jgi:oligogalacturonide lyase